MNEGEVREGINRTLKLLDFKSPTTDRLGEVADAYAALAERLMVALVKERGCEECWKGQSCGTDCHMNDVALKETR